MQECPDGLVEHQPGGPTGSDTPLASSLMGAVSVILLRSMAVGAVR